MRTADFSPEEKRANGPAIDAIVGAFVAILRRSPRHEFEALCDQACRLTAELEGWEYSPDTLSREVFVERRREACARFNVRLERLRRNRAGGAA